MNNFPAFKFPFNPTLAFLLFASDKSFGNSVNANAEDVANPKIAEISVMDNAIRGWHLLSYP